MAALIATVVLFAILLVVAYCVLAQQSKKYVEASRLIVPQTTSVPMPKEVCSDPWVRYDVKLDDGLQKYIEALCDENRVPANIVMAIIETESNCDPNAKGDYHDGYYNSFGLMQIWASEHTTRCIRLNAYNLLDPYQNVRVGIDFLRELMATGHDMDWVLTFYNGGVGNTSEYARIIQVRAETLLESAQIMED